jgi:lysyl-tRNA synthetase class 2
MKSAIVDIKDLRKHENISKLEKIVVCGRVMNIDGNRLVIHDGTSQMEIRVENVSCEVYDIVKIKIDKYDYTECHGCIEEILVSPKKRTPLRCTLPEFRFWYETRIIEQRMYIINKIREFLVNKGFIEVQTPFLQFNKDISPIYQFITFNPRGKIFYLRIAPEEYLKRLLTVGFNAVFEISTNFRDNPMDSTHNPEFVSVELYKAFRDLDYMMDLIESLFQYLLKSLNLDTQIKFGDKEINLHKPWNKISVKELILEKFKVNIDENNYLINLKKEIQRYDPCFKSNNEVEILEKALEIATSEITAPTFVTEFPLPLKTTFIVDGNSAKRAELFIGGMEIANLGCDIYNVEELHSRYTETLEIKRKMGFPTHEIDPDLFQNFSYGCPPNVGAGIGVDRIVMLLTNSIDISKIILYPHKRSTSEGGENYEY